MELFLGLDGGGTKTAACILDAERREIGRGLGGPCNIATCDDETLRTSILAATSAALESSSLPPDTQFAACCAGVAGYTAKRRRAEFLSLLQDAIPAARHRVEPDYVVAWWGATEGEPGIIVIAGTGAVVYGRNETGEECRIDGRGYLLGDFGSAFSIGKSILADCVHLRNRHAETATDWAAAAKELQDSILEATGSHDIDDLIEWTYRDFSVARIAALAKVVSDSATRGNKVAAFRLRMAGDAVGRSTVEASKQLRMSPESGRIRLLGGIWQLGDPIREGFTQGLVRGYYRDNRKVEVDILEPSHDPAYGAALLAMQEPPS